MFSKLFLIGVFILSNILLSAQPRLSCDSLKNAFLYSNELTSIEAIVDTVYRNGKIYYKRDSIIDFSSLINLIDLDSNITFSINKKILSLTDSTECYARFQEYYKGVPVKGGGYTETYFIHSGGGPGDPCFVPISGMPYIYSGIDLDIEDAKTVHQIAAYLDISPIDSSELTIALNQYLGCEYSLIYQISYFDEDSIVVTSIVDAVTREIIRNIDLDMTIDAITRNFGTKPMNDSHYDENTAWLVSNDGVVRTYNYGYLSNEELRKLFAKGEAPKEDFIPRVSLSLSLYPTGFETETAYQTHWIAEKVISYWKSEFNVNFGQCDFIARVFARAYTRPGSNLDRAIFVIGDLDNPFYQGIPYTFAWPGVIGHETTHAVLTDLGLGYDVSSAPNYFGFPNSSLHEGLADIFGIYLRSLVYDEDIVWFSGDEPEGLGGNVNYNFEEPTIAECFTDVEDFEGLNLDPHDRADPLRHWFYLCVNGDESLDIPAIDANVVLNSILGALPNMSSESDYGNLMDATLNYILEKYGRCSDEFLSLARSWEAICVPTGYTNPGTTTIGECDFWLSGPDYVYEENEYLNVSLVNANTQWHYIWTLIGQKSTEYESTYGMTGNGQYGGTYIELIDFPTHNYYPQKLTIKAYCPALGGQYTQKHDVLILDLDGDDPTCDEYYNNFISLNNNFAFIDNRLEHSDASISNKEKVLNTSVIKNQYFIAKVFSITGQLLFTGRIETFDFQLTSPNALFLIAYYDESGNILKIEKKVFMD